MTTNERPVLEMTGVSLWRGTTRILDDVSWRVRPGEHWVVLGANGSGKTSLLSALTGYLPPSAGEMVVLGRRYRQYDWQQLRTRIGLVSSSVRQRVPDGETAFETVLSGRDALIGYWGRPEAEALAAARAVLEQVECAPLGGRAWGYLSQGERQRVLVGRALMAAPDLLVLDEPCAGLDPAAREHFVRFVQRLGSAPAAPTLVLVTHHVEEIVPAFTHALVLKAGRVLAAGPIRTTLTARTLSEAFDAAVRLRRREGRLTMNIAPDDASVF